MRAKDSGIDPSGVRTEILWALMIAEEVFRNHGSPLVVTSLTDGVHSSRSLHYSGCAVDLRIWHLRDPKACADELRSELHDDFDVVLEDTHIHVEWDPKEGTKPCLSHL